MGRRKQLTDQDFGHDFKVIKERFVQLNQKRMQRSLADLKQRQLDFIELLPLLYHTNHPLLPGYVSKTTASGIPNFSPSSNITSRQSI